MSVHGHVSAPEAVHDCPPELLAELVVGAGRGAVEFEEDGV